MNSAMGWLCMIVSHLIKIWHRPHEYILMKWIIITVYCSFPTSTQSTSTTFSTPPPIIPPTIPPKSKCARRARALSNDQACSGGTNIAEILTNQSAISDVARISRLHSYLCSSQRCFNRYVKTYRACVLDLSGARGNSQIRESVSNACTLWPSCSYYM